MEEKNRGNNAAETPPKENDFSVPNKRDYEEELLAIIQSDLPSEEIREKLTDYHDNDIASVFGELTQANRRKLYHILSDDEISDIFSYLDNVEDYIAELDAEKAADIIESMDADDAVDVLDRAGGRHPKRDHRPHGRRGRGGYRNDLLLRRKYGRAAA